MRTVLNISLKKVLMLVCAPGILFLHQGCATVSNTISNIDVPKPVFEIPNRVKGFVKVREITPFESFRGALYQREFSKLEVIVVPQQGTKVLAYVTTYKVGSRNEKVGHTGLAHLFEHMMFRGTPSFPEPFKTFSSWGDRTNALTNTDLTQYHSLVPKEVFEDLIKLESERMRKLTLNEDIFKIEKGAVVSERKFRVEDNPMGRLIWELSYNTYSRHPYKVLPIGFQKDLDKIPFEAALDFHKKYYAPNNAVIAIVGDVSFDEALSMLDRYYGDYEPVVAAQESIEQEPTQGRKSKRIIVPQKTESVLLGEASLGNSFADKEVAADTLMCTLLGGGEYGHLHEELVRKDKVAAMAGASCDPDLDKSLNLLYAKALPGIKVEALEKSIAKALNSFDKFLNPSRVERIKMLYLASKWSSLRNPMDLATQLADNMALTQNALYDFELLNKIQKVTLEDIRKRFQVLKASAKTRVILNPAEKTKPIEEGVISSFFNEKDKS